MKQSWRFLGHSVLLFLFFGLGISFLHAQSLPTNAAGVNLIPNPQFPAPHSLVEISLDAYSLETTGAYIRWYTNDVAQSHCRNERSCTITTGALGEEVVVQVALTRAGSLPLTSSIIIAPTVTDLILEAKTYVPLFYKGRALPSTDSALRAIAIIHDGSGASQKSYTYKWSQGSSVLFGGPVNGKNVLDFTMPHYDNGLLSVEIFNAKGTLVGGGDISLITVSPELHFYEQNPLRGLSQRELVSPFSLLGEETTISGEPYYMNTALSSNDADFTWKINNVPASSDLSFPNAITLRRVGESGTAEIDLRIVTKQRIPQFVEKAFKLFFD
ncbi:MAG: hypothetical protein K9M10_02460 [Candidatus Pacebacteria bacterium]|nr:hypothetical protein [Candidatus Paceibacterota bacterium]MCF7857318.1 hypothetical protein [Candidatus Paceibacterota bacterium]